MRLLFLGLLCCAVLPAQDLSFFVHDNTGTVADQPLASTYQFPGTPEGNSSDLVLKAVNTSGYTMFLSQIYIGAQAGTAVVDSNFSITGFNVASTIAPGSSTVLVAHFIPLATGSLVGYLQASYQVQKNGCQIGSTTPATQCAPVIAAVSTLSGTGLAPQLLLSYTGSSGQVTLQPNTASPLDFGNVSTSSKQSLTFTLANQTSAPINVPAVAIQNQLYASSAFALDTSGLPSTLSANASATFTVSFAPGQTGLSSATLMVGLNSYPIQGTGVVVADIDALQIYYVNQSGVRTLPQAGTPINLGQLVAGTSATSSLSFTVANPTTSFNAISIPAITVTGSGFAVTGAPSMPAIIQPGGSISFQLTFSPGASGTYTGTLSIGTRQFSLTGQATVSPVPAPSFNLSVGTLTSEQQVNLTIQLASASPIAAIGTLTMQFVPSVTNIADDPAIVFVATSGRQLQVNVAAGSQTATYQGQSAIPFQTGTTAGTITFTVTFPNGAPISQSFAIAPALISFASGTAVRQEPNLVVTLNGFDNTYSAGKLSFTFYDTSGKVLTPNGIQVDATSAFHQYFFTANQAGGAFSVQATFPVHGGTTQVGSVSATITNSVGQTSSTQTFQ